jgi:hypothetical protein
MGLFRARLSYYQHLHHYASSVSVVPLSVFLLGIWGGTVHCKRGSQEFSIGEVQHFRCGAREIFVTIQHIGVAESVDWKFILYS